MRFDDDGRVKAVDLPVRDLERTRVSPLRRPFSECRQPAQPDVEKVRRDPLEPWDISEVPLEPPRLLLCSRRRLDQPTLSDELLIGGKVTEEPLERLLACKKVRPRLVEVLEELADD
ncbi:MAG TPA: hypothetical protein VF025_08205 [Gaiellaceae bacterium]